MGRTGFAGRGMLLRWGPNHSVDTIFTRYAGLNQLKVHSSSRQMGTNGIWRFPL